MRKYRGKKSVLTLAPRIGLLAFLAITLSGLGYPNDKSLLIGSDVELPEAPFYDLRLESPESVSSRETFEVRLSLEHEDTYEVVSHANISVTGGRLLNEQQQDLLPDAVWRIEASSEDVVGLVMNIETIATPLVQTSEGEAGQGAEEFRLIDTVSRKYDVQRASIPEKLEITSESFDVSNDNTLKAIFGASALVLVTLAAVLWRHFRAPKR